MHLLIDNEAPAIVRLVDFEDPFNQVGTSLTYTDKSSQFQYTRFKKDRNLRLRMGEEKYLAHLETLKSQVKKSLLFQDEKGFYTYAGLASYLASKLHVKIVNKVDYPEPKVIPWSNTPKHTPYDYQTEAHDRLLEIKHGSISLPTGSGKSTVLMLLLKSLGLKSIVMTPSGQITEQFYNQAVHLFGKKYVGIFNGSKKESGKLFVICTAQSLTKVTEGTEHWDSLSKTQVFIADESHTTPAKTIESACLGVAKGAPYRFFVSATQLRGDGKDLVLEGVIGPIVLKKTLQELVDGGYLSKPIFRMKKIQSFEPYQSSDPNKMTRKHLYYNENVIREVAKTVNASCDAGVPTLVLIEEIEQFTRLYPYLRHVVGFAHGPLTPENSQGLPKEFHKSDPTELVDQFNNLKIPLLVGTSCITTGTDILPVKMLIYWQGGKSETQVSQAVGRGTRKFPGKTSCIVIDFDVEDIEVTNRHADERRAIYNSLYPNLKEM